MNKIKLKYFDILAAKQAFLEVKNITEHLRKQKNTTHNDPDIIEIAYDLQAGSYIEAVEKDPNRSALYTAELADILDHHISQQDSILDIGTGELTTLSLLAQKLKHKPAHILAFDMSWSRVYKGLSFAKKVMGSDYQRVIPFVADISEIPLCDKSINVTISSYALEPNGGKLRELMSELFRVTADKLVLCEPCYEINTEEGKKRMDKLGYIKGIDATVQELGGKLIDKIKIHNIMNPLNPSVCFVILPPPDTKKSSVNRESLFSVPGTNYALKKFDEFYFSKETGLCFPILQSIPVLKSDTAILASAFGD